MVTDKQYRDLLDKYEELNRKYAQMSRDIATIKLTLDLKKTNKSTAPLQSRKDVTRYSFMGKQLNKRQLVLNCIRQYIADTGTTEADSLLEMFPDYIQGSLGVIRAINEAEQYSDATERYFFKDDEVLHLDTGIYVISKDWTVKNIGRFIDVMETLGYEIKPIIRN
ncbi:hypothetical protein [Ruminococcus sp.]|uniref:hypothetical protein n=1 Tax=Ruminococcus sp. TaxID=41978 RepID=UPI002588A3D4|nr:hypothetical protein [Ruminococcus sp.]MCR5020311.1 hypothetical protein [Ruminococcus sp.]